VKFVSTRRGFLSLPALAVAAIVAQKRKLTKAPAALPWLVSEATVRVLATVPSVAGAGVNRTLDILLPAQMGSDGKLVALEIDATGKAVGSQILVERFNNRAMWVAKENPTAAAGKPRLFSIYQLPGAQSTASTTSQVKLLAEARDEDDDCFVIETPMFRCYFQKRGSALSSLIDRDGKDWINYRAEPGVGPRGSFGAYRGVPNFPAPPGMFHPGLNLATTKVVSTHSARIELSSTSNTEPQWSYRTVVYADRVEMTVLNAPVDYWWLYEGTPGGESATGGTLDFRTMRAGESDGAASQSWSGKTPWAGFRVPGLGTPFGRTFLVAHTASSQPKSSYYLANGVGSPVSSGDEAAMTVFGFGRDSGKAYVDHRNEQTFVFAMLDPKDAKQVEALANSLRVGPISVSSSEARPKTA
jgi:hypothetical protein